jgi:hypothetical protein
MEEFLAKWVSPYYLYILHANYFRQLSGEKQVIFNQQVMAALRELDEVVMSKLIVPFDNPNVPGWREHLTGSWFCGLKRWHQFGPTIGKLLLASEVCYAGQGYCFALACFANDESVAYLTAYLDFYLPRLDLDYDQQWAMPALMWIDEQRGTNCASRFLVPGGLWEQYTANRAAPYWEIETCKRAFWGAMNYCQEHFGYTA